LGRESLSPCYIAKGEGALVTDVDGNTFIDFTGGWGCLIVGHTPERVVNAVRDQAGKYIHTDFSAVPYEPYVELSKRLVKLAPGDTPKKVAFFNSGAEAVENAVKISRAYTGRKAVVVFEMECTPQAGHVGAEIDTCHGADLISCSNSTGLT